MKNNGGGGNIGCQKDVGISFKSKETLILGPNGWRLRNIEAHTIGCRQSCDSPNVSIKAEITISDNEFWIESEE